MGVADSLAHFFIKNGIQALILMVVLWYFMGLDPLKVPSLMLICFVTSAVASLIGSALMGRAKGWF